VTAANQSASAGVAPGTGQLGAGLGLHPPTADPITDPALPVRVPHSSEFGGAWFDDGPAATAAGATTAAANEFVVTSPELPAPASLPPSSAPASGSAPSEASAAANEAEITVSDPDWIRGRLSRLYEGVNHARETREGAPPPRRPGRRPNEG
nr:hypothetical protein [Micromonospora sp. DSM 115978]